MGRVRTIARRTFLIGSVALAGGVAFGWYQYRKELPNPIKGEGLGALTPYVLIDQNGVTIVAPRAEMGQGTHTTLAALVAEELELPWDQVRVMHGPPAQAYYNSAVMREAVPFAPTDESWLAETARDATDIPMRLIGLQITGGSTSVPDGYERMRMAGATARQALILAAARKLALPADQLVAKEGAIHAPDGTALSYVDLAAEAAAVDLPDTPALKPREAWTLLGKSLPRTDMVAKSTGTARFAIDVRLPGMVFASIRRNPVQGLGMTSFDASAATALPGVLKVLALDGGICAVANTTWAAIQALDATAVVWETPAEPLTDAMIAGDLTAALGDAPDRLQDAAPTDFIAEYTVPHLAHATMEPMSAAALLKDGKLQVWTGSQAPGLGRGAAATSAGVPEEAVEFNTEFLGGGFGRRAEFDVVRQVAALAREMEGTPVLLTWAREEDMTHDMYRPAAKARVRARMADGMVSNFRIACAAGPLMESFLTRLGMGSMGPDSTIVQGAGDQPYAFADYQASGHPAPLRVPLGSWRSVGASQNGFFQDCAMDELAHLAGDDPLTFRMRHLSHEPSIKVLEAVAAMSDWQAKVPGRAKGVAFAMSFGVPVAQVIEVENSPGGIRLTNAWIAADVGVALDPGIIEAQLSGAMVFGLSAAIQGAITFADGAAQQQNFWDYEPLRPHQCPPVAVQILQEGGSIKGVGEPGTPPAAPALANAIFALTGQRIRDLPLNRSVDFA